MKKKLTMVTAWDFPTGKLLEEAEVDYILVGDSLAMSILGRKDTKSVTIEEMVYHTQAVKRGVEKTPIISDMPIHTYNTPSDAIKNAKLLLSAGASMVKLEGRNDVVVKTLIQNNIQVVGHLGLLPQTAEKYAIQGRDPREAAKILEDAHALDSLGITLLVLECVPMSLAKKITETIQIPTIGIGAGPDTSGQVLVLADMLGLSEKKLKMVKQYVDMKQIIKQAVSDFKVDVVTGVFPAKENSFT